jgi:hypothetical protein
MSNIKVILDLDTESGEFGIDVKNMSEPGDPIDASLVFAMCHAVLDKYEESLGADAEKESESDALN